MSDNDLGLIPEGNTTTKDSDLGLMPEPKVEAPKGDDLGLVSDRDTQAHKDMSALFAEDIKQNPILSGDADQKKLKEDQAANPNGEITPGPKEEFYSSALRDINNAGEAFMSHFRNRTAGAIVAPFDPEAVVPTDKEKLQSQEHPLASTLGDIGGSAALFGPVAGAGSVGFAAASALSGVEEQAEHIKDSDNQLSTASRVGKIAVDAVAGDLMGNIFSKAAKGATILDRVLERGSGAGATAINQSIANDVAEGKPPDARKALVAGGMQAASIGIVGAMAEVPELRSLVMKEAKSKIGPDGSVMGQEGFYKVDPENVTIDQAKKILQDHLINPESLSPEFQQAYYDSRRQVALDNFTAKKNLWADNMGLAPAQRSQFTDTMTKVLGDQNLRSRESTLATYMASLVKTNPAAANKLLPFYEDIKNGADPSDIIIMSDILQKFNPKTQVEATVETKGSKVPETKIASPGGQESGLSANVEDVSHVKEIQGLLQSSEGPQTIKDDTGNYTRLNSGWPAYLTNKGYNAKELNNIFDKFQQGDKLTDKQQEKLNTILTDYKALKSNTDDADAKIDSELTALRQHFPEITDDEILDIQKEVENEWSDNRLQDAIEKYTAKKAGSSQGTQSDAAAKETEVTPPTKDADLGLQEDSPKYKTETPTFYSHASKVIDEKMPSSAPVEQVRGILSDKNGVKADELKWMGLDDFLAGKQKVTKQELQDFIKNNQVQVQEVEKGNNAAFDKERVLAQKRTELEDLLSEKFDNVEDSKYWHNYDFGGREKLLAKYPDEIKSYEKLVDEHTQAGKEYTAKNSPTKFSTWQLPGGKNYRELLLTLPVKRTQKFEDFLTEYRQRFPRSELDDKEVADIYHSSTAVIPAMGHLTAKQSPEIFKSSHFEEPNILAHVRMNDRTGPNGEKILHIEEVQSDWHQKGKKQGYGNSLTAEQEKSLSDLTKEREELSQVVEKSITPEEIKNYFIPGRIVNGYGGRDKVIAFHPGKNAYDWTVDVQEVDKNGKEIGPVRRHATTPSKNEIRGEQVDKLNKVRSEIWNLEVKKTNGVPDAPFKKTWPELAMKRMLRYAAENGYDKLTWTTGEQQAERYDLSKQVESIDWHVPSDHIRDSWDNGDKKGFKKVTIKLKDDKNFYLDVDKTGIVQQGDSPKEWVGKNLSDVIGKDVSEKINKDESGKLSKEGLKIGGEGMKGFYDQILPSFVNKYAKKWGGRVEDTRVPTKDSNIGMEGSQARIESSSAKVHSIDITPAMKKSVLEEGQPMFKQAPTWDDLKKDKAAYVKANKAGIALIHKYLPQLSESLVNPAYIYTKDGAKALGMYYKGRIEVRTGEGLNVYVHEMGHAVFDLFLTPQEKEALLAEGRAIYGKDADVEERIMQDFEQYAKNKNLIPDDSLWGKVKSFFSRLATRLKQFIGVDPVSIKSFYDAILTGQYSSATPIKEYANEPKFKSGEVQEYKGPGMLDPAIAQVAKAAKEIQSLLAPRTLVPRDALDMIMTMKGARDKLEFVLEQKLIKLEKAFDKMPKEEQVAFIDRIKTGQKQPTEALQTVADMMRTVEDNHWRQAKEFKPSLAYKENHYRVMWKVIPGSPEAKGGFHGLFKRPFQGTQGWAKKSTLEDMSEGIKAGGVPYSFNPITMWKNSIMDMQKFITARRMWNSLKQMGYVKFVRPGESAPSGFVIVDDKISHVYLPVEATIGEGQPFDATVEMGKYFVEPGSGRILNNFLGRDYIRESAVGSSLLAFKNLTTGIELSLSPFHAAYVTLMASSSNIGLGLQKIANRGIINDPKAFLEGLKDIAHGVPIAGGAHLYKVGSAAIKFIGEEDFLKSKEGQDFIKTFPEAATLLDDLFIGGGKLAQHQDYKITSLKAFQQGIRDFTDAKNSFLLAQENGDKELMQKYAAEMAKNAWAEVIHALPSVNQMIMRPLFEVYIPRLKIGAFLKEYSNDLVARRDELSNGRLTRAQLARDTWDSVERRFGEMNFDNLFWNRNFKTALQLLFRSVTWKYGALQNIGGAATGQLKDLAIALEDKKLPKLNRNLASLLGLLLMVTVFASILQKLLTNKSLGQRDDGQFDLGLMFKDILDPRYDDKNNRLFFNTHLKDWAHLYHSPGGFLSNSLSGMFGRVLEDYKNKDFFNTQIHNPREPWYKQDWDMLVHMVPLPFSLTNQGQLKTKNAPPAIKALTAMGFTTPAPGYVNDTPVMSMAKEIASSKPYANMTHTKEEEAKFQIINNLRQAYFNTKDSAPLQDAEKHGIINFKEYMQIKKDAKLNPLVHLAKHFSFDDTAELMNKAIETKSVDEQHTLWPLLRDKYFSTQERATGDERRANVEVYRDIRTKLGK